MGLFDIFSNGHGSQRHKKKHAPSYDTRLTHRFRETPVSSSTPNSLKPNLTPNNSRRKDKVPTSNHHSKQPRSASYRSRNDSHVTVDCIGTPSGRSLNSYQPNHSQRQFQRANEQSLSSPSKRATASQCGENVLIAHKNTKRAYPPRSSSAVSWKHELTVPEPLKVLHAKHVTLRDHFPSPTNDPCDHHPAIRPASPASSAPPALPPRPHEQLQWRRVEEDAQTEVVDDDSPGSSSPISACSSSCESVATTMATTVVPEEIVPRNSQQEYLRQLSSVGFAVERQVCYPVFGTIGKKQVSFEVSQQKCGYISHRVDSITLKGRSIVFPRNTTVGTLMEFEEKPGRDKDRFRIILGHLLMSEEMQPVDLPYILPCYYWVKMHLAFPHVHLSPLLRMQCNERQRRMYRMFDHIVVIKNDTELVRNLTGADTYDNSVRLCAFLELFVERFGPFRVLDILNRILGGRKHLQYGDLKLDHLTKASPDSINNLIATIVHSLSQHLAVSARVGHQLQRVADVVSLVLSLSGELGLGKVFRGALPKLVGGEVTLCYSLLLATDLADDDGSEEMWILFVQKMDHDVQPGGGGTPMVIIAIAVVLYLCRDGSQVFFPKLYMELSKRNLQPHAKMAWKRLGGDGEVWNKMVREFQRDLDWQMYMWDNREEFIEAAWREEVAREHCLGAV